MDETHEWDALVGLSRQMDGLQQQLRMLQTGMASLPTIGLLHAEMVTVQQLARTVSDEMRAILEVSASNLDTLIKQLTAVAIRLDRVERQLAERRRG